MEHRYYGQSTPFGSSSFSLLNLQYLTIDQAVEDYATFLKWLRSSNPAYANAPIIVFGGSYAALLSTLLRAKHPDLVLGAISSAAPIFLYSSGINGDLYYDTVSDSYTRYYPQLASAITNAFQNLKSAFGAGQYSVIQQQLNLCSTPRSSQLNRLVSRLKHAFAILMQFNYPNKNSFSPIGWPITYIQQAILQPGATWGTPLAQALNVSHRLGNRCYELSGPNLQVDLPSASPLDISALEEPKPQSALDLCQPFTRATDACVWMYQVCTEFVQPQSGTGIFVFYTAWSIENLQAYCSFAYPGTKLTPYAPPMGNFNNPVANFSNVLFANGLMDPIRTFSPRMNQTGISVLNIEYAGHCEDINAPRSNEPSSLPAARQAEGTTILNWLSSVLLNRGH